MNNSWKYIAKNEKDFILSGIRVRAELRAYAESPENNPTGKKMHEAMERHGPEGLDPYFAKYRTSALAKAKSGDISELVHLIRKGELLNKDERDLCSELLLGKIPSVLGAPKKYKLSQAVSFAFFWLNEVDGENRKNAIAKCEAIFNRSPSTVERHLTKGRTCKLTQERFTDYRTLLSLGEFDLSNFYRDIDLHSE